MTGEDGSGEKFLLGSRPCGCGGNEKADVVDKSAVRRERVDIQVPLGRMEVKSLI